MLNTLLLLEVVHVFRMRTFIHTLVVRRFLCVFDDETLINSSSSIRIAPYVSVDCGYGCVIQEQCDSYFSTII
jgi:hypothetical protein